MERRVFQGKIQRIPGSSISNDAQNFDVTLRWVFLDSFHGFNVQIFLHLVAFSFLGLGNLTCSWICLIRPFRKASLKKKKKNKATKVFLLQCRQPHCNSFCSPSFSELETPSSKSNVNLKATNKHLETSIGLYFRRSKPFKTIQIVHLFLIRANDDFWC